MHDLQLLRLKIVFHFLLWTYKAISFYRLLCQKHICKLTITENSPLWIIVVNRIKFSPQFHMNFTSTDTMPVTLTFQLRIFDCWRPESRLYLLWSESCLLNRLLLKTLSRSVCYVTYFHLLRRPAAASNFPCSWRPSFTQLLYLNPPWAKALSNKQRWQKGQTLDGESFGFSSNSQSSWSTNCEKQLSPISWIHQKWENAPNIKIRCCDDQHRDITHHVNGHNIDHTYS